MKAAVSRIWLAQTVFPITHFTLWVMASYIAVYEFGNYDHKFDAEAGFIFYLYLSLLATALSSLLYSITFLASLPFNLDKAATLPLSKLLSPMAVSALIHFGLFSPIVKIDSIIVILLWLLLPTIVFGWLSAKFIADEQQTEFA